jgi:hypothetical protein
MSTEQNRTLIGRVLELMNQHDLEAAFGNFGPNFKTNKLRGMPSGIEAAQQFFTRLNAFPDYQMTLPPPDPALWRRHGMELLGPPLPVE